MPPEPAPRQDPAPRPPRRRGLLARILAEICGVLLFFPTIALGCLAVLAPFSLWGWLVTIAISTVCVGLLSVPWRTARWFGPTRLGLVLLLGVTAVHAALAGRTGDVHATVLPDDDGPRFVATLVDERDVSVAGAFALTAAGAFPRRERGTLLPLARDAYARLADRSPALPTPLVPTLLGMESASATDTLLIGPPGARRVVVFLHGFAGNFAYECATVARAATEAGWATVCPSTDFSGRWGSAKGEATALTTIRWARAHHPDRVVLAGLSAGGIGASRIAPHLARDIDGVLLLSGVDADARRARDVGGPLPTLVIQGDQDGMCDPEAARAYARRTGARLAMLHGTHFLLLENEPAVRGVIVEFLNTL